MAISTEEFLSLSLREQEFYLEQKEFLEFVVRNGRLCFNPAPQPFLKWERFCAIDRAAMLEDYARTDNTQPHVVCRTDYADWNPYGRPYAQHGFEFSLHLDVRGNGYTKEAKRAEKQILTDWLKQHGATDEELTGISWNGHGYSATFRCHFTDVPPEHLPAKVKRWAKKNPQYNACIYA